MAVGTPSSPRVGHLDKQVFVIAAEYSAEGDPKRVFTRAEKGAPVPDLENLMQIAALRALRDVRDHGAEVEQLLVTTMPFARGEGIVLPESAVRLASRLKKHLIGQQSRDHLCIGAHCEDRFEIGTSDAGASLFASAYRLLRGIDGPATALVVAGQVMPGGQGAIDTVAQVLEDDERALGLRMIPVGDLLLDALWARLPTHVQARYGSPSGLAEQIMAHKLRLATEYPSAQRREGDAPRGGLMARWLTLDQMAPASNGACAVVLTTDAALARHCARRGRVVRVVGVGMGEDDTRVSMRPQPFIFLRSIRQALVELRRDAGVDPAYLRRAAFSILHDAFPSIELAFLLALGFSPSEAVQRALSYWPNPYGGLTAFGHALAASGLVQIVKAFHVFMRPKAYIRPTDERPLHPDYTVGLQPVHCLTTSVGGPLTHVVCTLLESVPGDALDAQLARSKVPPGRFFEAKATWVQTWSEDYRRGLSTHCEEKGLQGLGILEARTHLDLPDVERPLPPAFLERWTPRPIRLGSEWLEHPAGKLRELLDTLLGGPVEEREQNIASILEHVQTTEGKRGATVTRRDVLAAVRIPVALVFGGGPALASAHPLCLLPVDLPVGTLVQVEGGPLPVVQGEATAPAHLVPLWYGRRYAEGRATLLHCPSLIEALRSKPLNPGDLTEELRREAESLRKNLAGERRIPQAAVQYLEELILSPELDRWALAEALGALQREGGAATAGGDPAGYCEFDIVRASQTDEASHPRMFEVVVDAMERARGWLGPVEFTLSQVADRFSAVARVSLRDQDDERAFSLKRFLFQVVRFALDVYERCRDRGVPLRAAVTASTHAVPIERAGQPVGTARGGQMAVHRVMNHAREFGRLIGAGEEQPTEGLHGIAVVVGRTLAGDQPPEELLEELWQRVLGAGAPFTPAEPPVKLDGAWYQVRRSTLPLGGQVPAPPAATPTAPVAPTRSADPPRAPSPPLLTADEVSELCQAFLAAGLVDRRGALVAHLPNEIRVLLPRHTIPHDQIAADLTHLSRMVTRPDALKTYLKAAQRMSSHLPTDAFGPLITRLPG